MTRVDPISPEAERSLRTLNRLAVLLHRGRPAFAGVSPWHLESRQDLNEAVIVRAFSVLEAYLLDRADELLVQELPVPGSPSPLVAYLYDVVLSQFRTRFETRVEFWKNALGVDLRSGYPKWSKVSEHKDLRNTLTHALGYMHPRRYERIPKSVRARLARVTATPELYMGRIPIDDRDADDSIEVAKDVIQWLERSRPHRVRMGVAP